MRNAKDELNLRDIEKRLENKFIERDSTESEFGLRRFSARFFFTLVSKVT